MKNYWQLREDITAGQKTYLRREYDVKGFNPADEKLFLKVTKGKRDANGIPDFTGVTLCDMVALNVDDFGGLIQIIHEFKGYSRDTENFLHSDYKIKGWYPFQRMVENLGRVFDLAFGDALMGAGKSEVINVFRSMKACANRGDWARFQGGTLYRGKRISWKQFSGMPWRVVGNTLECAATYQSKLAMQSWTTNPKIASKFASGDEGAMADQDLVIPQIYNYDTGEFIRYGKDITGFLPVIIQANVPAKDCFLNPKLIDKLQRKIGHGYLKEEEVLRLSTEPIRAKFIVGKGMLKAVTEDDSEIQHIFDIVKKRK